MNEILQTILILTSICLLFGVILAVANKKLWVYEDPRIQTVEEMLPSANCGACGEPGCRAFAEQLVNGEVSPSKCTVSSEGGILQIAEYLGVEAGKEEKKVARLLCAGGIAETGNKSEYTAGIETCRAEAVVAGGAKACNWGCLGLGDCVNVCDFDAIHMNENGLPQVVPEKCTACGDCVDVCPKDLFTLLPVSEKLIVQCRSLLEGDEALDVCQVACTTCGKCAMDSQKETIVMKNGLPQIDYSRSHLLGPEVTVRCPTNAITWLTTPEQFTSKKLLYEPTKVLKESELDKEYFQ